MADLSFIEDSVAFPEKEEDEEEEEEGVEWGYEEGVEWGLVFPDANGEYQSPINLNSREARYDPSLLDIRLSPNYVVCRDCEVANDGHTIQVILKSKSVLSGGPLPQGHEFELYEVRFHWGRENQRGSEHTVNFKAFPMELHLIHWNSTLFGSIDEAVGKPHGIAIIALFVQIGKEHVGLKAVTEILQDIQYKGKSKTIPCFNPNTLLPDPLLRDYWVYEGSLTIPPCSEGVTWILFRYPLTISQLQIEEFRRLRTHVKGAELVEGCDGILGDNFRPTQPLSDRLLQWCPTLCNPMDCSPPGSSVNWSGFEFPPPEDFPNAGIKPVFYVSCIRRRKMVSLDKKRKLSCSFGLSSKPALFSSSNPTVMDICDSCLYTSSNEILEMAVHSNGAPYSVSTSLLLVFTFLHLLFIAYV